MADRTDDLLISVSTDLSTIKRQLKQLGQDVGTTTSGIQKQFDGLGKGIDQSLSPVQKRINDMLGIANTGAKPLKEWKGALADAATGFSAVGKGAQITSNQLLNLSRQGNDVVTMFALGAKPMQVFASQAGQIFGALQEGPGGVTGSLKGLAAQAAALATRFPLATAAIAAAGVALAAYLALGGTSIRSLDEILKSHEENIKRLGDAYDQVVGKQQKYAQVSAATANLVNDKDLADAKTKLQTAINDIFKSVTTQSGVGRGGGTREFVKAQFQPFEDAINDLKNSAKDTSALRAFTDAVTAIGNANPDFKGAAAELITFTNGARDASSVVETLSGGFPDAINNVDEFNRALGAVDSKSAQKELQDLFDKASDGKVSIDDIKEALAKLEQANPDLSPIIAEILRVTTTALGASSALANMYASSAGGSPNGRVYNPIAQQVEDAQRRGASIIPTPAPNREDLGAEYDKAVAAAQRKADAASRRANRAAPKTADDRFSEDLQSIRDRTAALNEEYNALGLSFEAQTQRKTALDLEQTALKQVREEARKKGEADWQNAQLTPDQIAKINAVSDAYAKQADELRKAQDMQDLQRDVLKGAFDDLRSALDDGKLDWQDFAKIAEGALDKIIDKIENDLIDSILQANGAAGGSGGILGSLLGLVTGGGGSDPGIISALGLRANGGPVTAGQPYIVGEKRAELFVPNQSGTIVPRVPSITAGGGGGQNVSVSFAPTINMPNAQKGAGEEVAQALKKFEREFTPRVLKSLRDARTTGMV
ncbi:phage tail length tape measure family protein [Mesorhizobium sp. BR-1-1-8]|uniref:phage tail length tape measure family protein n=1 Tax=Mesorhizobium sp. BR-1-1-8 TaxID=2876659 RepID=UPI001CCF9845|nr:phage tail length tape measure family protein [Mesorhizobium sp. BR-1-1-8]MBZ9984928.1 phage tail length tape measure family protein [Mesorhizobium sp. BR-1-1-8]